MVRKNKKLPSVEPLRQWLKLPLQLINVEEEPDLVQEILQKAKEIQRYAVKGKKVLIQAVEYIVLLETQQDIVWVDALHKCGIRFCFTIEKSVLRGLGLRLKALPSWRREKFEDLFCEVIE